MNSDHNLLDILKAIFLLVQGLKNALSRGYVSVTWQRDVENLTSQLTSVKAGTKSV